jgi:hypothetical protein
VIAENILSPGGIALKQATQKAVVVYHPNTLTLLEKPIKSMDLLINTLCGMYGLA